MQERYRNDYDGEFVILNTFYKDGKKQQEKEWVANPIENQHISARAAVVGHGESRENFNLLNIQDHFPHKNRIATLASNLQSHILAVSFFPASRHDDLECLTS